jgi:DEAD/DEAH box helicase domain-containing protein
LNFNIHDIPSLDILEYIDKALGHRISLETVARATLGAGKSGSGKDAVVYYKTGKMDLLKKYCLDDVKITRQVYEYVLKNRKLLYQDFFKVKEIPMVFEEPAARVGVTHQSALF